MPTLAELKDNGAVKMLVVGDPGAGKTGALASLAKAGYTLRIADFDHGLDPLVEQLRDDPEALRRVHFESFADEIRNGKRIAKAAQAFAKAFDSKSSIGPVTELGPNDVFVIDSLTSFGKAVVNDVAKLNAGKMRIQDWGAAVDRVEDILALACSDLVKCHVIILAHLSADQSDEGGILRYYPKAVTAPQSRTIARLFNTVVQVRATGSGKSLKRTIVTVPQPRVSLKCPFNVPDEIPISEGYLPFITKRRTS